MNRATLSGIAGLSLLVQTAILPKNSNAEEKGPFVNYMGVTAKLALIDGLYSYREDGVLVIGWIIETLKEPQVRFRTCNDTTHVLDSTLLVKTPTECPQGSRVKPLRMSQDGGKLVPWYVGGGLGMVFIRPEPINIGELPASLREALKETQPGDLAAFVYETEKGTKEIGIIKPK